MGDPLWLSKPLPVKLIALSHSNEKYQKVLLFRLFLTLEREQMNGRQYRSLDNKDI